MRKSASFKRWTGSLLVSLSLVSATVPGFANAAMISPGSIQQSQQQDAKARLNALLARDDVRQGLLAEGVDPASVESRVASLSNAEAEMVANKIDQQPAGQGVIGAIVLVFLVLLVTDILGFTNVFSFVNHH
ncbi:PA2779 family protein [Pokkaliibacter sp. CJK22405]|uniref:PA2779 family protein n=1 Tax=Pokkaliibacter sp. CJK22405 TaxID=3384615 RepID=UPI00398544F2